MGITSLQACMDSSNWLQDTIHEETQLDSPSQDRPLMERKLRPQHDQPLNCPRCDSTHTKFCYYNNYSLTQPRYFCKSCRRYWTKGGTLRNIPVGGGCRKNKKVSSKKNSASSIPEMAFMHAPAGGFVKLPPTNNFMLHNNNPDFIEDFLDMGTIGYGEMTTTTTGIVPNYFPTGFGTINYDEGTDVKPNLKMLSLEWHDQLGCSINNAAGIKEYLSGGLTASNWTALMNGVEIVDLLG